MELKRRLSSEALEQRSVVQECLPPWSSLAGLVPRYGRSSDPEHIRDLLLGQSKPLTQQTANGRLRKCASDSSDSEEAVYCSHLHSSESLTHPRNYSNPRTLVHI